MLDDCDISFSIDLTPIKTISILLGVLEEASAVVIGRCFFLALIMVHLLQSIFIDKDEQGIEKQIHREMSHYYFSGL